MPWIPEDAPYNLLAVVPASQWNAWADGASFGTAPHRQAPTVFACRINRDVTDPNGIHFKKGMQGQFLGMSDKHKGIAIVFIQGVTEGDGFTNRAIPRDCLDLGKPWKADIDDWHLTVDLATKTFNTQNWGDASMPDTTVLGQTITRLVTACTKSPPQWASPKLLDFFNKVNVTVASQNIIQGIKTAGLYELFSKPQHFDASAILKNAEIKITNDGNLSHKAGIYGRFHRTNDKVTFWKKKSSYLYVGKTTDFSARFIQHRSTKTSYGELTRNSTYLCMAALCVLRDSEEDGLYFLAEQVFVCLLQTYKDNVITRSGTDADYLKFFQAARYFTDISNEVFRVTGWQGGIARGGKSFGVDYGANCSSPLMEYGSRFDKLLFIRTDANIKDGKTGSVVPMAFYHKSNHTRVRTATKASYTGVFVLKGKTYAGNTRKCVFSFAYGITKKTEATDFPLHGTPYELVIEVRKDGTRHPHAWARLAEVGGFENWDQANSFAVRIEWQHPPNSGNWRFRYLQATFMWKMVDEDIPGSLPTYVKAITFLQWLTNSIPNHSYSWIPRVAGCARVLQANYDLMNQSITFEDPTDQILMMSGRQLPSATVKDRMNQAKYGLTGVDSEFGGSLVPGFSTSRRTRCDTCMLLQGKKQDISTACVQYKNSRVCKTCRSIFNRPCCSWTLDLKPISFASQLPRTAEEMAASDIASTALISLPFAPATMTPFRQKLRELESSEQLVDDGSDYEDEDDYDGDID